MRLQRQRLGVFALVFGFLAVQLAGFVHLALEQHAVCAEHGELQHLADSGDAPAGPISPRQRAGPDLTGASGGGEHAHCDVLPAVQPKHLPPAGALARSIAPPARAQSAPAPSEVVHAAVPLLLLAPKQSPPA